MGYKVNFTDNQSVNADEINAISLGLDESVETDFADGVLYGVDALNSISASLITSGVSSGCDVVLSDGIVTISSGVAYFADGKKMTIDSDGITLAVIADEKNYVWLLNDEVSGVVSAKCTTEEPSGDCVRLAEISSSGKLKRIKDKALMKNSSILPNSYEVFELAAHGYDTETETTFDVGKDYRKMVFVSSEIYSPDPRHGVCYFDWDEGKVYTYDGAAHEPSEWKIQLRTAEVVFKSYENNVLTFSSKKHYSMDGNTSSEFRLICM